MAQLYIHTVDITSYSQFTNKLSKMQYIIITIPISKNILKLGFANYTY